MTTQNIGLLQGLAAKMDYLNERQRIVSQNIANSDTPEYRPQDLKEMDFSSVLGGLTESKTLKMDSTNDKHLPAGGGSLPTPKSVTSKHTYEVTPTGNAVVMEEQLMKAGQTLSDYNLMTSLYQKQIGMIKTAIGRGG